MKSAQPGAFAAAVLLLAGCAADAPLLGGDPRSACESLASQTIEAARIAVPGSASGSARIESATLVAASALAVAERGATPAATITPAAPQHCRVLGRSLIHI